MSLVPYRRGIIYHLIDTTTSVEPGGSLLTTKLDRGSSRESQQKEQRQLLLALSPISNQTGTKHNISREQTQLDAQESNLYNKDRNYNLNQSETLISSCRSLISLQELDEKQTGQLRAGLIASIADQIIENPLVRWLATKLAGLTKQASSIICAAVSDLAIFGRPSKRDTSHCLRCCPTCANMDYWCRQDRDQRVAGSVTPAINCEHEFQEKFEDCRGGDEINGADQLMAAGSPVTPTPDGPLCISATPPATGPKPRLGPMEAAPQLSLRNRNNNNNNNFTNNNNNYSIGAQENVRYKQQLLHNSQQSNNQTQSSNNTSSNGPARHRFVLVDESSLGELKNELAHYVGKVRDMEHQIRVIPDLERRLDEMATIQHQSFDSMDGSNEVLSLQSGSMSTYTSSLTSSASQRRLMDQQKSTNSSSLSSSTSLQNANHHHQYNHNNYSNMNVRDSKRSSNNNNNNYISFATSTAAVDSPLHHRSANITNLNSTVSNGNNNIPIGRSINGVATGLNQSHEAQSLRSADRHHGSVYSFGQTGTSSVRRAPTQMANGSIHRPASSNSGTFDRNPSQHLHDNTSNPIARSRGGYDELIQDLISLSYHPMNSAQSTNRNQPIDHQEHHHHHQRAASLSHLPPKMGNHGYHLHAHHQSLLANDNQTSNQNHNQNQYSNFSGSLSLQSTPIKSPTSHQININNNNSNNNNATSQRLDCGCLSFRDHNHRYNSLSRENRLKSPNQFNTSSNGNHQHLNHSTHQQQQRQQQQIQRVDAATNTEIGMSEIVTRAELDSLVAGLRLTKTKSASILKESNRKFASSESSGASSSASSSSSDRNGRANCLDGRNRQSLISSEEDENRGAEDDDDDGDSQPAEELQSLGSSCRDPSDFEEYCAYGETLERRTRDFLSKSAKIPNDLRFALIRLNDVFQTVNQQESETKVANETPMSSLKDPLSDESVAEPLDCVRRYWFEVVSAGPLPKSKVPETNGDESTKREQQAQLEKAKLYLDYFESFNKQLLNAIVNLSDRAGNTAMHYASSDLRLSLMQLLLDTHLCDLNKRNKAGYTPLMLLALVELSQESEELARRLFSTGDLNIKCKSRGQTALMLAASHGRSNTCRLLLECGADPSLKDVDGSTALMCASEFGHHQIVRCLLQHRRTDPTATDNDGLDALTIALNNGHRGVALLLFSANNVPARSSPTQSDVHNTTFIIENDAAKQRSQQAYLSGSLRNSHVPGSPRSRFGFQRGSARFSSTSLTGNHKTTSKWPSNSSTRT